MKVAFLDRDGTIIRDYPDEDWRSAREPEFLPGAMDAMARLLALRYDLIVVTNQYLIGEGVLSLQEYHSFDRKFQNALAANGVRVLDTFFCPHARWEGCGCCKPKPGMIQQAMAKHPDIDLSQSFLVGDSAADAGLSAAFGLPFFGIGLPVKTRIQGLAEVPGLLSSQPSQ